MKGRTAFLHHDFGGIAVNSQKRIIVLTDDNWADNFPFDYPELLVQGLQIPDAWTIRHAQISLGNRRPRPRPNNRVLRRTATLEPACR
jgi:hypothetical protein